MKLILPKNLVPSFKTMQYKDCLRFHILCIDSRLHILSCKLKTSYLFKEHHKLLLSNKKKNHSLNWFKAFLSFFLNPHTPSHLFFACTWKAHFLMFLITTTTYWPKHAAHLITMIFINILFGLFPPYRNISISLIF